MEPLLNFSDQPVCNFLSVRGSVEGMKELTELNESSFQSEVLESNLPVLVDFYAPWCGPCKMLAPILAQLALEFQGRVKIAKLNVDEAPGVAARYNVTGVPTLILFSDGKEKSQMVGLASTKALKTLLESATSTGAAVASNPQ